MVKGGGGTSGGGGASGQWEALLPKLTPLPPVGTPPATFPGRYTTSCIEFPILEQHLETRWVTWTDPYNPTEEELYNGVKLLLGNPDAFELIEDTVIPLPTTINSRWRAAAFPADLCATRATSLYWVDCATFIVSITIERRPFEGNEQIRQIIELRAYQCFEMIQVFLPKIGLPPPLPFVPLEEWGVGAIISNLLYGGAVQWRKKRQ